MTRLSIKHYKDMEAIAQNNQLTDEKIAQFECCGTKEAADKDVTEVCGVTKAFERAPPC